MMTISELLLKHQTLEFGNKDSEEVKEVFFTETNQLNHPFIVSGGASAKFFTRYLVLHALSLGLKIRVLDSGLRYKKLIENFGGHFVAISPNNSFCLNPFSLIKPEKEGNRFIRRMTKVIQAMCSTEPETELIDRARIERALWAVWRSFGETANLDRLSEVLSGSDGMHHLADAIEPYTSKGEFGRFFNGEISLDCLSEKFLVFDLSGFDLSTKAESALFRVYTSIVLEVFHHELESTNAQICKPALYLVDSAWERFFPKPRLTFELLFHACRKKRSRICISTDSPLTLTAFGGSLLDVSSFFIFPSKNNSKETEQKNSSVFQRIGLPLLSLLENCPKDQNKLYFVLQKPSSPPQLLKFSLTKEIHHLCSFDPPFFEKANEACLPFASDILEPFDHLAYQAKQPFLLEEEWQANATIALDDVAGTKHPDYAGHSWLHLLQWGKRMPLNIRLLQSNPGYYTTDDHKEPTMSYIRLGNKLYIDADGNHRTCIARFFLSLEGVPNPKLSGVEVRQVKFDEELFDLVTRFKSLCKAKNLHHLHLEILSFAESREDGEGWKKDRFRLQIQLENHANSKVQVIEKEELAQLINRIETAGWAARLFSKNPLDRLVWG